MPIDARIALMGQPVQLEDPAERRLKNAHAQFYEGNALRAEQQAKDEYATNEALKRLGSNYTDEDVRGLAGVDPKAAQIAGGVLSKQRADAMALRKESLDVAEKELNAKKTKWDTQVRYTKTNAQLFAPVENEQQRIMAIQQALRLGSMTEQEAQEHANQDFAEFMQENQMLGQMTMTLEEQDKKAKSDFDIAQGKIKSEREALLFPEELKAKQAGAIKAGNEAITSAPLPSGLTPAQDAADRRAEEDRAQRAKSSAATLAETIRGHNMTNSRAIEQNAKARDGRPSSGVEKRALGFYQRAQNAEDEIGQVEPEVLKFGFNDQFLLNHAPNIMQSTTMQRFNQARRAFTEARLRKDSGAAIPLHEYENDERMGFPRAGDGKEVLEQKKRYRASILNSLKTESGKAYREHFGEDAQFSDVSPKGSPSNDLSGLSTEDLFKKLK